MEKPNLVISRCFLEPVRYNGVKKPSVFVDRLKDYINFISVCPEMEIGLGVPRLPVNLIQKDNEVHMIQRKTESDFTRKMLNFSSHFLKNLKEIDGFILKSRSPSCGISAVKIYDQTGEKIVHKGEGLFAGMVKEQYPFLLVESEGRLLDPDIRENFLTAIFALAELRRKRQDITSHGKLVEFHTAFKFLFMAFSQNKMKIMGKVVANHNNLSFSSVMEQYEKEFKEILTRRANRRNHINVLQHIFGYFSPELTADERKRFLFLLQKYKDRYIQLSFLREILRIYTARMGDRYLMEQRYFNPYPDELQWF